MTHARQRTPSLNGHRWHVHLEEYGYIGVDLSATQATMTGLAVSELHERLPAALQRLASGRLRNDLPVLDQVAGWDALRAEHIA